MSVFNKELLTYFSGYIGYFWLILHTNQYTPWALKLAHFLVELDFQLLYYRKHCKATVTCTVYLVTVTRKGKEKEEYLYSAFILRLVSKHSDMDHTVLPANYTMPVCLLYTSDAADE